MHCRNLAPAMLLIGIGVGLLLSCLCAGMLPVLLGIGLIVAGVLLLRK